jgi:probable addiction module antidote protein
VRPTYPPKAPEKKIMSEHGITLGDLEGLDLEDFDSADYLTSDAAIAAYLTDILEANDAALLASAIGNIARARGMTEVAKAAGKALRPYSQPRFETITRVVAALGMRLVAEPIPAPGTTNDE